VVVCWLVVAMAVLVAVAGSAAADQHVTVTRDGDSVTVTVSTDGFNENGIQTTNVSLGDTQVASHDLNFTKQTTSTPPIPVSAFRNVSGDHKAAMVNVTVNGTTVGDTVDLRYVEKSDGAGVDGRNVTLPVNGTSVVGIPEETAVSVRINDSASTTTVDGIYHDSEIRVPMSRFESNVSLYEDLQFSVLPNTDSVSYDVNPQAAAPAYVMPSTDVALVSHPLVYAGETYDVRATTEGPDGTFSRTVTAGGPTRTGGTLSLPAQLLYAEKLHLRIDDGDREVYNRSGSPESILTLASAQATVEWNTTRQNVTLSEAPAALSSVWIQGNANGPVERYDASVVSTEDATATLEVPEPVREAGDNFTVALVGQNTYRVVSVTAAGGGGEQDDGGAGGGQETTMEPINVLKDYLGLLVAGVLGTGAFGIAYGLSQRKTDWNHLILGLIVGIATAWIPFGWWIADGDNIALLAFFGVTVLTTLAVFGLWSLFNKRRGTTKMRAFTDSLAVVGIIILGLVPLVLFDLLPISMQYEISSGVVYGYTGSAVILGLGSYRGDGDAAPAPTTYRTTIRVQDSAGTPIRERMTGTVNEQIGPKTHTVDISDGSATIELEEGRWEAKAKFAGQSASNNTHIQTNNERLDLVFDRPTASVTVLDQETGEPIPDVDVIVSMDEEQRTGRTNENGQWAEPLPVSASEFEMQVDHEQYESASWSTTDTARGVSKTLELRPLVGSIHATVTLDGMGIPGIPVTVVSQHTANPERKTTTEDGSVTLSELPVGNYTIQPSLEDYPSQFSAGQATVTVRDGETARAKITIEFDYRLSSAATDRVRTLRSRATDIGTVNRRDGAIPAYYASVVESIADVATKVLNSGYPLLVAGVSPDEVIGAILDAGEVAAETISDVMTSKRNVDLFSACSDLQSVSVTWQGQLSVSRVTELATQDIGQQRGEILDQLETVDERISASVSDMAEVSPAREMWEAVRTMVRDNTGATQVQSAALIAVAEALLDAIDGLFDDDDLRRRMERTVY
jgi:5-hydroxyisourate hydrolase-like protein (transthyretin family)